MAEQENTQLQGQPQGQALVSPASASLQLHTMSLAEKLKYGATVALPTAIGLEIFGASAGGIALALAAGGIAAYWSEEIRDGLIDKLPTPKSAGTSRREKLAWLITGRTPTTVDAGREPHKRHDEQVPPVGPRRSVFSDDVIVSPVQQTHAQQAWQKNEMVDLATDLHIPKNNIIGKALFVCGIRRHGKTTLGARLAEQLGKFYIPMFIPDLEGDYISLADVLPRAVIAGHPMADQHYLDYDFVPLGSTNAAFQLGYDLLESGCQVILDMASYPVLDQAAAVQVNIIRGMFKWANEHPAGRVPAYVYLDEAQRFLPQNLNDSVIKNKDLVQALLDVYMDIIAIGGKRGINPVVLTQRFAQVNNKIMAQSEVFFLMRQTHDGDLKRCMEYANDPITKDQISKFQPGEGIYIATDGMQHVTQFYDRESSGKRSSTPQAEAAQRYATQPKRFGNGSFTPEDMELPVYKKAAPVNRETPVYTSENASVNGATSQFDTPQKDQRLRLLGNTETPEIELKETEESSVNVNVNAETREAIVRMVSMNIPHRQIAKAFKLDGRNYPTYKQICKELGIATEREA